MVRILLSQVIQERFLLSLRLGALRWQALRGVAVPPAGGGAASG